MTFDKEQYQKTFSHLRASPELRKELSEMTEQTEKARKPKRFMWRKAAVLAAVTALAFALAMGANAATGGELYEATIGKLVYTFTLDDGGKAEIFENDDGGFTIVEHPEDADGETSESSGDVSYEEFCEVETDEDGNILHIAPGKEPVDPSDKIIEHTSGVTESGQPMETYVLYIDGVRTGVAYCGFQPGEPVSKEDITYTYTYTDENGNVVETDSRREALEGAKRGQDAEKAVESAASAPAE